MGLTGTAVLREEGITSPRAMEGGLLEKERDSEKERNKEKER